MVGFYCNFQHLGSKTSPTSTPWVVAFKSVVTIFDTNLISLHRHYHRAYNRLLPFHGTPTSQTPDQQTRLLWHMLGGKLKHASRLFQLQFPQQYGWSLRSTSLGLWETS